MPGCPELGCQAPITGIARYGRVLKRRAIVVAGFKYTQQTRIQLAKAYELKQLTTRLANRLLNLKGAWARSRLFFDFTGAMRLQSTFTTITSCNLPPQCAKMW